MPVIRDGRPVGVLAVGWTEHRTALTERDEELLRLLAAEAAITIHRTDLLARLQSTARTDPLTGLPNRRVWDEDVERELERARRHGGALCLAMVDLDRFKAFNDTHGHQAGDELLAAAATAWRPELRATDTLARYGGEEFAVLLPHSDEEGAQTSSSACSRSSRSTRPLRPASPSGTAPRARTSCSPAPTRRCTRPSTPAVRRPAWLLAQFRNEYVLFRSPSGLRLGGCPNPTPAWARWMGTPSVDALIAALAARQHGLVTCGAAHRGWDQTRRDHAARGGWAPAPDLAGRVRGRARGAFTGGPPARGGVGGW